jgi:hypothetical protein
MRAAVRLFAGLILLMAGISAAEAERRVALVIGNSSYEHVPVLANPSNDAADIASVLKGLGVEVVEGTDLKQNEMRETMRRFGEALQGADVSLFFYAGHGMQVAGTNYLVPTDAKLAREAATPAQGGGRVFGADGRQIRVDHPHGDQYAGEQELAAAKITPRCD